MGNVLAVLAAAAVGLVVVFVIHVLIWLMFCAFEDRVPFRSLIMWPIVGLMWLILTFLVLFNSNVRIE